MGYKKLYRHRVFNYSLHYIMCDVKFIQKRGKHKMMNEKLNELESKIESNSLRNDEVLALVETLNDAFTGITKYSNSKHDEMLAIHELNRVSGRMETLFFMLQGTLEETTRNNDKLLEEIAELKNEMVTV